LPEAFTPGAIPYGYGAMAYFLGTAVREEPPALANLFGASVPSIVCLARNYPFKYASVG
ncbi:hypothetical protein P7K49_027148, partial [Saguinus oedipus]